MNNQEILKSIIGKTIKNITDIREGTYEEEFIINFTDNSFVKFEAHGEEGGYFVLYSEEDL